MYIFPESEKSIVTSRPENFYVPVRSTLNTQILIKKQKVKTINEIKVEDYDILVLPGGVKAMEKVRQNKDIIKFISDFDKEETFVRATRRAILAINFSIPEAHSIGRLLSP